METLYKTSLWQQFGAAIDMLANPMNTCPDELWCELLWQTPGDPPGLSEFWYLAYHTLFWLDFYLSGAAENFVPPKPFTLSEFDPAGLLPDRVYTKAELQAYWQHCRQKCYETIQALTDEDAARLCHFGTKTMSFYESLLYNMRHVQEHAAQLNLFLGQRNIPVVSWVGKAREAQ